jgi:uncharacterized repeat protein (TIGR01451 family)
MPFGVNLDEVTLGSANPDAWAVLKSAKATALPGEQLELSLQYGNRGLAEAYTSTITVTLPSELEFIEASVPPATIDGQTLTWVVGVLPGESEPDPIAITVLLNPNAEIGEWLEIATSITASANELETGNNLVDTHLFIGVRTSLPFIIR